MSLLGERLLKQDRGTLSVLWAVQTTNDLKLKLVF